MGFTLGVPVEGSELLEDVLAASGLVEAVSSDWGWLNRSYRLGTVADEVGLNDFLDLIQGTVLIDLRPGLNECYALGPYSVFEEGEPARSIYGNAVHRAKYWGDESASSAIARTLVRFVQRHPRLRTAGTVTAPPKSDAATRNLPLDWAREIATALGVPVTEGRKVRPTEPQKDLKDLDEEVEVASRVADSVVIDGALAHHSVLIVDDTLRSGGTLMALASALRDGGADYVFGLCVAKDAKFTNGGIDLSKERWQ